MKERTYIAIDLKSFYASVECRERNPQRYKPGCISMAGDSGCAGNAGLGENGAGSAQEEWDSENGQWK